MEFPLLQVRMMIPPHGFGALTIKNLGRAIRGGAEGFGPPGFSVARALAERRAARRTAPEAGRACGRARGAGSQAGRSEAALENDLHPGNSHGAGQPGCTDPRAATEAAGALFQPRP